MAGSFSDKLWEMHSRFIQESWSVYEMDMEISISYDESVLQEQVKTQRAILMKATLETHIYVSYYVQKANFS